MAQGREPKLAVEGRGPRKINTTKLKPKVKKKKNTTNLNFYEIQQNIMVVVNLPQRKSVPLFYILVYS